MVSTFHGIEMGKRSLITHTQAMNVTGQNLNNVNTEGYSRQVIHMNEYEPIYMPECQVRRSVRRRKKTVRKYGIFYRN